MIQPIRSIQSICKLSKSELQSLAGSIQKNGLAIFYKQNLTEQSFVKLMKNFGECETPNLFMNHRQYPEIFIVTGKKDKQKKKIGMFGTKELDWHSNGNSRSHCDKHLIGLYCKISDPNTTLSVCNTSLPFYNLTFEEREYFKSINLRLKFQNHTIYSLEEDDPELKFMSQNPGAIRKLVDKHPFTNQHYFYFPYGFIIKAWSHKKQIDHYEFIKNLKPIIFKSYFQYHHIFQEGDLILMDQLTTLHRRTCSTENRELWRVACDYNNICRPISDQTLKKPAPSI